MFLDTSGIFALLDRGEPRHQEAVELYAAHGGRKLTHDGVLAELLPLATRRKMRRGPVLTYLRGVVRDPQVEVVWADRTLYLRALDLLDDRSDKEYSFCDAISFVLMRDHGLTDALTTDHHFEQEGFVRLLR